MISGKTRLLAVIMIVAMMVSIFVIPSAFADEVTATVPQEDNAASTGTTVSGEYEKYLSSISGYNYAKEEDTIYVDALSYKEATGDTFTAQDGTVSSVIATKPYQVLTDLISGSHNLKDCLVWSDNNKFQQQGSLVYEINVPKDAIYNVRFTYLPIGKTGGTADESDDKTSTSPITLGMKVDGQYLYAGIDVFTLPRTFVNVGATVDKPKGDVRVDSLGNQLTPEQVEFTLDTKGESYKHGEFMTAYAKDPVGIEADPYLVYLTAGKHLITLESKYEPFALASIEFIAPQNAPSYSDYIAKHEGMKDYEGAAIEVEGEDAWLKSTNSLVSKADNASSDVKPHSVITTLLNYIGNTNWQTPGQAITWVVDVPADGLYTFGVNYKQANVIDGFTYRMLEIDDTVPFEECKNIRFNYCTSWEFFKFGDENGAPYKFYLTEGKHTFKLTVTLGETADFYTRLNEIVDRIGDTYIDIVMITGDSPDTNRDYDLFKQIPNFQETLLTCYEDLNKLADDMKELSGVRSNKYISALNNMSRVLKSMYDNQYTAQNYLTDYYSNYTTVCSWLYEMKTMPLSVDQFQLASANTGFTDNTLNSWDSFVFGVKRFFASFSDEFSTIGGTAAAAEKGKITIWVNWGRDQTQVLSNLIQDSFTDKTGISVQLEIVNATLVKGILAGNFPDLSLHLARTDPVNLGMRGALYDLTNFSAQKDPKYSTVDDGSTYLLDYETALKRFQPSADMPYWYEGDKLYALPDTQGFFIMYYRTDIFESLGIPDPSLANDGKGWTWKEFMDASTILQRNNMDAYIPYTKIGATTTVNAGMGSLNMFPTILAQNGVDLYNESMEATTLTSTEAISAFTQWTDFYTKHGIEKQMDFYNRFRVGTAPLGISSYATYTQLNQTAPEIQGRWKIALIPGTMQEDGTIDRSIAGSGTGCSVVAPSPNKDGAWQFLCWWTDAQTQLRYNNNVESILGAVSRTATANIEAFSSYSWNAEDLEILRNQWDQVKELPEVPGGYYVSRAVDQAFWEVLNDESNEKDAMLEWGKVADNEIIRKINEYR